ncbi:TPA: hypothetical protein R1940_001838 [Staphylococcus delphini]|nr:hypothetical protein [Staphylococcus delphini]HEC2188488.1 hypothetical protein [Staphylococcus delphini]HEC2190744.1 hypothetical protein [Staphylococcus delphini]HEC2195614.1 hypothetical protein [Staphylococcus delphini]HEC2201032.1 hypothetical protein [Staphylococcus delphini]
MKIAKLLTTSFIIWLILFLIDYLYELFQISESGERVTLMGLKIESHITKDEINTYFSLTPKLLLSFIIVLISVSIIYFLASKLNKDKKIE